MRYIYMNNFRGFTETLIPLKQVNFLVGENSTGKSSLLSLLALVNKPIFWLNPAFAMREELGLSSFGDMVSAWSADQTCFQVGAVAVKQEKAGIFHLSFSIHEFVGQDDSPILARHFSLANNILTIVAFEQDVTKYKIANLNATYKTGTQAIKDFMKIVIAMRKRSTRLKSFPKAIPPNSPLPIAVSVLQSLEKGEDGVSARSEFKIEIPMGMNVTWIAPIRTKPKRIYDGIQVGYSPEGEHAPMLLRKSLKTTTGTKTFSNRLKEFGDSSGLFETVIAHAFGKGIKNPFELLIRFKGAVLNISNVGYGVSQALPLIVEFLSTDKRSIFAVQQPEVHLHPRAQAALGGLIFELAKERKHSFFIETHSDYLIDRYRLSMRLANSSPDAQMLFFMRTSKGNMVSALPISSAGQYPSDQPKEFREFFVREEMKLLDI